MAGFAEQLLEGFSQGAPIGERAVAGRMDFLRKKNLARYGSKLRMKEEEAKQRIKAKARQQQIDMMKTALDGTASDKETAYMGLEPEFRIKYDKVTDMREDSADKKQLTELFKKGDYTADDIKKLTPSAAKKFNSIQTAIDKTKPDLINVEKQESPTKPKYKVQVDKNTGETVRTLSVQHVPVLTEVFDEGGTKKTKITYSNGESIITKADETIKNGSGRMSDYVKTDADMTKVFTKYKHDIKKLSDFASELVLLEAEYEDMQDPISNNYDPFGGNMKQAEIANEENQWRNQKEFLTQKVKDNLMTDDMVQLTEDWEKAMEGTNPVTGKKLSKSWSKEDVDRELQVMIQDDIETMKKDGVDLYTDNYWRVINLWYQLEMQDTWQGIPILR